MFNKYKIPKFQKYSILCLDFLLLCYSFASSFSTCLSIVELFKFLSYASHLALSTKFNSFFTSSVSHSSQLTPLLLLNVFPSLLSHPVLLQPCLRLTGKLTRCNFLFMFVFFYHFATWILCFLLNSSFWVLGFSQEPSLCIVL